MKKKFAFLLMGSDFDPEKHRAEFETDGCVSIIQTVRDFDDAKAAAVRLYRDGVGVMELCGAFDEAMADELAALTDHKVGIGYVINNPSMDPLFARFFGE